MDEGPPARRPPSCARSDQLVELVGVLHVHSAFSDGSGSPSEIVEAASACGLDFVGINDHESLAARDRGFTGRRGGVLVLSGAELHGPAGDHHLLAYGIDRLPARGGIRDRIDDVNAQGGIAIAAHPCERHGWLPGTRAIRWKAGAWPGLAGVEVWNFMSQWKEGLDLFDLGRRLREPRAFVGGPSTEAVGFWRKTGGCAIAGLDAHAFRLGLGRLGVVAFPYRTMFAYLRTHLLVAPQAPSEGVPEEQDLLEAMREGMCFCSDAALGDARGFRAARRKSGIEAVLPGSALLSVSSSEGTRYVPAAEGPLAVEVRGDGPLAVEVFREGRTWIWCAVS